MSTEYEGLYVQRLLNGKIISVQIINNDGYTMPIAPDLYVLQAIEPPIDQLPDRYRYSKRSHSRSYP